MLEKLDAAQLRALSLLYNSPSGLPFHSLDIDNTEFVHLSRADLVSEPEGTVIDQGGPANELMVIHSGLVRITPPGKAAIERFRKEESAEVTRLKERAEDKRERRIQVWKDRILGYIFGVLTGVTVVLITQYISGIQ